MSSLNSQTAISISEIEVISKVLLTLEAVDLHVGIPVVHNTEERWKLRESYFSPSDDFIKSSLVTITTPHLSEYLEALDSKAQNNKLSQPIKDFLSAKSRCDFIIFPFLVVAITFSLVLPIFLPYAESTLTALLSSTFSSLGALLGAIFTTTDQYRFYTFKEVIKAELARRGGKLGDFPTHKLPLTSLNLSKTNSSDLL